MRHRGSRAQSHRSLRPRFGGIMPSKTRGRGEGRALAAPMAACKKARGRHHRFSRDDPAFPARWVYGCSELSPGTGCLAPVTRALVKARELGISSGMPGPHGLAVREGTSHEAQTTNWITAAEPARRTDRCRSSGNTVAATAPRLTFVTIAIRPFRSRRDGRIKPYFLEKRKRNFAANGLMGGDGLNRQQKL